MKVCQNLQEFLQAFFPENAELEGFRKRLAADATPDREGLTEALREPDAKKKSHPFGWRLFLCCQNIIDQQINRAYGSTPAAGSPPCPCAFSFWQAAPF